MEEKLKQLVLIGKILFEKNDLNGAFAYLSEVIKENQKFPDVYNRLGVICHIQGEHKKAVEYLERAVQLNPNYSEALLNLSIVYNDQGKYGEAKKYYQRATALANQEKDGVDPIIKAKLANKHVELGDMYWAAGFLLNAREEYQKGLKICPQFLDIALKLAQTYIETEDKNEALKILQDIKEKRSNYPAARIALGTLLYKLNRIDEARAEFEAVLRQEPANEIAKALLNLILKPTP